MNNKILLRNREQPPRTRPTLTHARRQALQKQIGYTFQQDDRLEHALIHPSLANRHDGDATFSNQRLEFLGDRVLGLVMADILMDLYPDQREGYLTGHFNRLVNGKTCTMVGEKIGLRTYLLCDASLDKPDQDQSGKAVADAVEALIAAIYKDGGLDAARDFIKRHWIFPSKDDASTDYENPKTRLSEWCNANKVPHAVYTVLLQDGPAHAPVFTVKASVEGHTEITARGRNKQKAEMSAAALLLDQLEHNARTT